MLPFEAEGITEPTLVVWKARARANLRRMALKAADSRVRFRPHFKTHQSAAIGRWFSDEGIDAITVSSLPMAWKFARQDWTDITIAVPLNPHCGEDYNALAAEVRLHLLTDSAEAVDRVAPRIHRSLSLWIEIDSGQQRTGIDCADSHRLVEAAQCIRRHRHLHLQGLLTHAGHSYRVDSELAGPSALQDIYRRTLQCMQTARETLQTEGFGPLQISVGDTPTCSTVEDFGEVDEIRPGNFLFYDLMQWRIGSCTEEDIALAVACPVISRAPQRGELVVHGGAVHLSKDTVQWQGRPVYGRIAEIRKTGWSAVHPHACVKSLTQEHGVIEADRAWVERHRIGDPLMIIPVHSCLAADALGARYYETRGISRDRETNG